MEGAGVPSPAGVAAFESDALSPLLLVFAGAAAGDPVGDALMSFEGDSALTALGSKTFCNSSVETLRVTTMLGLPPDLRRPSPAVLLGGAICYCDVGYYEIRGLYVEDVLTK